MYLLWVRTFLGARRSSFAKKVRLEIFSATDFVLQLVAAQNKPLSFAAIESVDYSVKMSEQEFVSLLQALLEPNTDTVKNATETLKQKYYTSPNSLSALLRIVTSHDQPELRQLAAVEARKLVFKHWSKLPESEKPELRQQLLQSTIAEEARLTRNSKARIVAEIAKSDFADNKWDELPSILQRAATSDTARHREVGIYSKFTKDTNACDGSMIV